MIEYELAHISDVSHATFERLLELTLGLRGNMQRLAHELRKHGVPPDEWQPDIGMVVLARNDSAILGWTLIDYDLKAEIFVDPEYRRQGIATGLIRKLHEARGHTDGHYYMPYVREIVNRARAA